MGISVRTAETVKATTPYYSSCTIVDEGGLLIYGIITGYHLSIMSVIPYIQNTMDPALFG